MPVDPLLHLWNASHRWGYRAGAWICRHLLRVEIPPLEQDSPKFTGSCPIREHTGDGAYVGRCDFATYDGFCPRHGAVEDYPTRDDREVRIADRRQP